MESSGMSSDRQPKLLDRVVAKVRLLHYSKRTESAYVDWIRRYILFHNKKHPKDMGAAEVEAFLTDLAVEHHVSASTQNQAFAAILFLYRQVLNVELPSIQALRAKRAERIPVVLSTSEVRAILAELDGMDLLLSELLYGTGMRILECCRLRVKDVDFARRQIVVRQAKGPSAAPGRVAMAEITGVSCSRAARRWGRSRRRGVRRQRPLCFRARFQPG